MTATSYSFSTTTTDLSQVSGWTETYGDAGALYTGGGQLKRIVTTNAECFYQEGRLVNSGSQKVGYTFNSTGSTIARIVALGSGTAGAFNGYLFYASNGTSLWVQRCVAGAATTILQVTVAASQNLPFSVEILIQSGQNVINVYDGSGTSIGTFTDTNASRPTSGYNGIRSATSAATTVLGTNFLGNMQDAVVASGAGVAIPLLGVG